MKKLKLNKTIRLTSVLFTILFFAISCESIGKTAAVFNKAKTATIVISTPSLSQDEIPMYPNKADSQKIANIVAEEINAEFKNIKISINTASFSDTEPQPGDLETDIVAFLYIGSTDTLRTGNCIFNTTEVYVRYIAEGRTGDYLLGFRNFLEIRTDKCVGIGNDPAKYGKKEEKIITKQIFKDSKTIRSNARKFAKELKMALSES